MADHLLKRRNLVKLVRGVARALSGWGEEMEETGATHKLEAGFVVAGNFDNDADSDITVRAAAAVSPQAIEELASGSLSTEAVRAVSRDEDGTVVIWFRAVIRSREGAGA